MGLSSVAPASGGKDDRGYAHNNNSVIVARFFSLSLSLSLLPSTRTFSLIYQRRIHGRDNPTLVSDGGISLLLFATGTAVHKCLTGCHSWIRNGCDHRLNWTSEMGDDFFSGAPDAQEEEKKKRATCWMFEPGCQRAVDRNQRLRLDRLRIWIVWTDRRSVFSISQAPAKHEKPTQATFNLEKDLQGED